MNRGVFHRLPTTPALSRAKDRQLLQADIMNTRFIGPLQKSRINGYNRPIAGAARPAAKVTACCSPYQHQNAAGISGQKSSPVPADMAAVIASIFSFFRQFNQ